MKGASSVWSGDVIAGHTWSAIASARALFWAERVESKSNPVDGLSRGLDCGPWKTIETARLPAALLRDLQLEIQTLKTY